MLPDRADQARGRGGAAAGGQAAAARPVMSQGVALQGRKEEFKEAARRHLQHCMQDEIFLPVQAETVLWKGGKKTRA